MESLSSSSKKSSANKIRDIVRLQQMLKKWKKLAHTKQRTTTTTAAATTTTTNANSPVDVAAGVATNGASTASRSIKFLKKTLSFTESSSSSLGGAVPKGYVAVCVGKDEKRFVIPTKYLSHQVFAILLREAEEEFGFQQQGVLKLPCEVDLFDKILSKMMLEDDDQASLFLLRNQEMDVGSGAANICSPSAELSVVSSNQQHHSKSQVCR